MPRDGAGNPAPPACLLRLSARSLAHDDARQRGGAAPEVPSVLLAPLRGRDLEEAKASEAAFFAHLDTYPSQAVGYKS